jgi:hypothetical protein
MAGTTSVHLVVGAEIHEEDHIPIPAEEDAEIVVDPE